MSALIGTAVLLGALSEGGRWTVYFQENCLPCRKQLREMKCWQAKGWELDFVGIGTSRLHLMHELLRTAGPEQKFSMLSWSEAAAEGVPGTPFHLLTLRDGRQERRAGWIPCPS